MKFWDASAIVPLLVAETTTPRVQALAAKDPAMLVWWSSEVECVSALARLERNGALDPRAFALALRRLQQLAAGWHEVDPSDAVREAAARFLRVHPLRAADALQLWGGVPGGGATARLADGCYARRRSRRRGTQGGLRRD